MKKEDFYQFVPQSYLCQVSETLQASAYWYFTPIISHQLARLRACLQPYFHLQYAVKANSYPPLLRLLAEQGIGADVSSGGELQAVITAGFDPKHLSFSGPGKTQQELAQAVACHIGAVNVEHISELDILAAQAQQQNRPAWLCLRVNPDKKTLKSGLKMAGNTQFGIAEEQLPQALDKLRTHQAWLSCQGIHIHAGSQVLDAQSVVDNLQAILDIALRFESDSGIPLRKVNCGGGWGIDYFSNQAPLDLSAVRAGIEGLFAQPHYHALAQRAELIVEPGRFIVGESGVYASKVLYRKTMRDKSFVVVEGGMHHHYLLAGGMGQVLRRNFVMDVLPSLSLPKPQPSPTVIDVAGSLCTPQDVLAVQVNLPFDPRPGDTVVFFNSGAYGLSASPIHFLHHPLPTEQLLDSL